MSSSSTASPGASSPRERLQFWVEQRANLERLVTAGHKDLDPLLAFAETQVIKYTFARLNERVSAVDGVEFVVDAVHYHRMILDHRIPPLARLF